MATPQKRRPHKYQDKPAEYITAWAGGPRSEPYVEDEAARGIVYEIDGTGKVGAVHAGGPSIQLVEGWCVTLPLDCHSGRANGASRNPGATSTAPPAPGFQLYAAWPLRLE
jgi:hypothetical protein